jgi:hypothetical protein
VGEGRARVDRVDVHEISVSTISDVKLLIDFGISTGLINQNYWENSKWCCVNVERGNAADKLLLMLKQVL